MNKTCSQIAIESGYPEIANLFIEENEGDKITLLFDSSENENITLLTKLLDEGIDPNSEIFHSILLIMIMEFLYNFLIKLQFILPLKKRNLKLFNY